MRSVLQVSRVRQQCNSLYVCDIIVYQFDIFLIGDLMIKTSNAILAE